MKIINIDIDLAKPENIFVKCKKYETVALRIRLFLDGTLKSLVQSGGYGGGWVAFYDNEDGTKTQVLPTTTKDNYTIGYYEITSTKIAYSSLKFAEYLSLTNKKDNIWGGMLTFQYEDANEYDLEGIVTEDASFGGLSATTLKSTGNTYGGTLSCMTLLSHGSFAYNSALPGYTGGTIAASTGGTNLANKHIGFVWTGETLGGYRVKYPEYCVIENQILLPNNMRIAPEDFSLSSYSTSADTEYTAVKNIGAYMKTNMSKMPVVKVKVVTIGDLTLSVLAVE